MPDFLLARRITRWRSSTSCSRFKTRLTRINLLKAIILTKAFLADQQRLLSATDPRLLEAYNIHGALRLPGVPHADLLRDQQRLLAGQAFHIPGLPQHGLNPSAISLDPHLRYFP
jgi:hypothetical protein